MFVTNIVDFSESNYLFIGNLDKSPIPWIYFIT